MAELTKTTPSLQANVLTFVAGEKYVKESMSIPGGVKMFETANAGGSSGKSEVISFEILHLCEDAAYGRRWIHLLQSGPCARHGVPADLTGYEC